MSIRKGSSLMAMVLALSLSLPGLGQGRRNQQQQKSSGGEQAQTATIGPRTQSAQELSAFNAFQNEPNAATKVTMGDTFLTTYPNSELTGFVQLFRMEALTRLGKFQDAIAAGETGLSFEAKFMEDMAKRTESKDKNTKIDKNSAEYKAFLDQAQKRKLSYYQLMMSDYQQLDNADKTLEYGEKTLSEDPENLAALLTVSTVMTERPPTDDKKKDEQMNRALERAKKAEAKVTELLNGPAGAQMRDNQKAELLSSVHQTLGLANLHLKKYSEAEKEYASAISAKKDDPISYYRLGVAYAQDKKLDQGMEALAKSVYLKGVSESEARTALKQLYEAKNKSSDGLEEYIKTAGQKIGQ